MRSLRFSRATRRTSILGIALAFAGTTLAAMAATPLFPDPVHKTAVGDEPRSTASGDFNGDGKLDLAVANRLSGDVSILLGQGDGTFGPQIRSAAGDGPVAVDVGDFNRDGRQDLAVAVNTIGGSGDASILLGNGDGTFAAPTRYRAGDKTFSIAVGDFNADGLQDLAVGNNTDCCGDVSVLVGAGDGTFGVDLHYNVLFEPTSIVVADFNRDGLQDMAVANHYGIGTLSVLIGNGRAGFDTILSYEAGANSISVADGDFDGDGILDLAVSNSTSNDISLFPGLGDGTFGPKRTFFAALNPRSLVVADFDGDGRQDLMFLGERSFSQRAMAVALLGRGDGTFVLGSESGAGEFAASISVADFNGDGRQDLAVSNPLSDDVWSMAGIGDGSFGLPTRLELRDNPISLVASDLNGDHLPDVAFEQYQAKDVGVALGRGDGSLVFAGEAGSTPWPPLAVGEINGDGTPDLVLGVKDTVYSVAPGLAVALGLGNGAFGPQTNIGTFDLSNPVDSVALGDFNGDGRIDLAVGRRQLFGQTAFV